MIITQVEENNFVSRTSCNNKEAEPPNPSSQAEPGN